MKITIQKKETGNETVHTHTVNSIDEVKDIISEFGHNVRFIVTSGQNIIFIDTRPKYEYRIAYYNLSEDEFFQIQNYEDDNILDVDNVSYDTMIDEVLYILENNCYSIKHSWEPIDTNDIFDISAEDFERLIDGEELVDKTPNSGKGLFSRLWKSKKS